MISRLSVFEERLVEPRIFELSPNETQKGTRAVRYMS